LFKKGEKGNKRVIVNLIKVRYMHVGNMTMKCIINIR
jgi:hypothetical protein